LTRIRDCPPHERRRDGDGTDLGLADALATALAVAGVPALPLVEELDEFEALIIDDDGNFSATAGFPFARTPSTTPG